MKWFPDGFAVSRLTRVLTGLDRFSTVSSPYGQPTVVSSPNTLTSDSNPEPQSRTSEGSALSPLRCCLASLPFSRPPQDHIPRDLLDPYPGLTAHLTAFYDLPAIKEYYHSKK